MNPEKYIIWGFGFRAQGCKPIQYYKVISSLTRLTSNYKNSYLTCVAKSQDP